MKTDTILFMVMDKNKIQKKETIKRTLQVLNDFVENKDDLLVFEYNFGIFNSKLHQLKNKEIEKILNGFISIFRLVYRKNEIKTLVFYPEMDWDYEQNTHQLSIRFCVIGNSFNIKKQELVNELESFVYSELGGDIQVTIFSEPDDTDVFVELYPIHFELLNVTYGQLFKPNIFPEFYSRDLYNFLLSPIVILKGNFIKSNKQYRIN